jgi:hypothetical protein
MQRQRIVPAVTHPKANGWADKQRPTVQARARRAGRFLYEASSHAVVLARLTRDLTPFLRTRVSVDDARAALRARLATREQRFLDLVQRTIYGHTRSPYRRLLQHAGCEIGDLRALVSHNGIEGALQVLAERGVYVTFDELKGRRQAVRGSTAFDFRQADFDNPLDRPHIVRFTGGSGGAPSRVAYSLPLVEEWAHTTALTLQAHGISNPRHAFWSPGPLHWLFSSAKLNQPVIAWFYPLHPFPLVVWLLARYLAPLGRLGGHEFPIPRRADLERPEWMVDWVADHLAGDRPLVLWAMASAATRLCIAAREAGRDLTGLTIRLVGEPVTEARRQHIEASGAKCIVQYSTVEIPALSYSCATPLAADDVHIMTDRYALIQRRRAASIGGPDVDALLITSLSLTAPKILLNTEPGDYARLEDRDCGCLLGALGLRTHLAEVRSFEKLTGEGVTFARSMLQQILEEILPSRFGGAALDYQLVEEETTASVTRLVLQISPSVGEIDEQAVRDTLLAELGRGSVIDRYQANIWRNAQTIQIRRERPLATRAGKVLPFQMRQRAAPPTPPA